MTSSEQKELDRQKDKDIADADRKQKEKSDERSAKSSFYGSVVKGITGMLGKMNDPKWYRQVPGMDKVTCSIPDFTLLGSYDGNVFQRYGDVDVNVPAVVRINYGPTIGNTQSKIVGNSVYNMIRGEDAFNRALNYVATKLENRNSRVLSYSRDTIGRYIFIVTDVANDLLNLKSCLDVFDMYSTTKPFLARQIIRAKGFDYADFKANISAYRESYVQWANDFNAGLPLPGELTFTKRQLWLANTIAMDSSTNYYSCIVFHKAVRFEFDAQGFSHLSQDVYVGLENWQNGYTYVQYVTHIAKRFEKLIQGATWKPLIRDLRGGTKNNMWLLLPNVIDKKTVSFTSVDEVRSQIHNMSCLPCIIQDAGEFEGWLPGSFTVYGNAAESVEQNLAGSIRANSEFLTFARTLNPGSALFELTSVDVTKWKNHMLKSMVITDWGTGVRATKSHVLSYFSDAISADDFLVGTRLKATYTAQTASVVVPSGGVGYYYELENQGNASITTAGTRYYGALIPVQYGTEVIISIDMLYDRVDNTANVQSLALSALFMMTDAGALANVSQYGFVASTDYVFDTNGLSYGFAADLCSLGNLVTLDWYPLTSLDVIDFENDDHISYRVFGELDHYTLIGSAELGKLNDQCIESEAFIPESNFLAPLK